MRFINYVGKLSRNFIRGLDSIAHRVEIGTVQADVATSA